MNKQHMVCSRMSVEMSGMCRTAEERALKSRLKCTGRSVCGGLQSLALHVPLNSTRSFDILIYSLPV